MACAGEGDHEGMGEMALDIIFVFPPPSDKRKRALIPLPYIYRFNNRRRVFFEQPCAPCSSLTIAFNSCLLLFCSSCNIKWWSRSCRLPFLTFPLPTLPRAFWISNLISPGASTHPNYGLPVVTHFSRVPLLCSPQNDIDYMLLDHFITFFSLQGHYSNMMLMIVRLNHGYLCMAMYCGIELFLTICILYKLIESILYIIAIIIIK